MGNRASQPTSRTPEQRYDDLLKIFPKKENFLEEYKISK